MWNPVPIMRTTWATIGLIGTASCLSLGCDAQSNAPAAAATQSGAADGSATDAAGAAAAGGVAQEAKKRISLLTIPFTAEVPASWDVQTGAGGHPVLHGRVPSGGDVDILLAGRGRIRPDALAIMLKEMGAQPGATQPTATQPTTQPDVRGAKVRTRVIQQPGLTLIETIERMSPDGRAPEVTAYSWTVKYISTAAPNPDFPVFELNVPDLSGVMVTADQEFLRSIFESLQPETAPTTLIP